MYISASKQFDKVVVWEQRTNGEDLNIKTFNAPYECYIQIADWKACKQKLRVAVDEGDTENIAILKEFLGAGQQFIDTSTEHLSMYKEPLFRLKFSKSKELRRFTDGAPVDILLYESDIPPELKVLSANYYQADLPKLNVTFYDIEVNALTRSRNPDQLVSVKSLLDQSLHEMTIRSLRQINREDHTQYEFQERPNLPYRSLVNSTLLYDEFDRYSSTSNPEASISSIAFYHAWKQEYVCYAVPPCTMTVDECEQTFNWSIFDDITVPYKVVFCRNESELLMNAVEEIQQSDLLSGWNSSMFDDPYFAQRVEIVLGDDWFHMLSFPKGKKPYYSEREIFFRMQKQVQFDGRITVDYLELFKKFTVEDRDSWSLESVSSDHLGERFKKMDYEGTLHSLYHENFSKFVRYNIRDTEVLAELDKKYKFIQTGNDLIHQSTCHYKNIVGTVRTAEMAMNNYCWYEINMRVPNTKVLEEQGQAAGAYVLVPQTGLKKWIMCCDVTSLYPSCILTLNISPECLRGQFIEFERAWECIFEQDNVQLTIRWEIDGRIEIRSASDWREYFLQNKLAISGYGTVFDQTALGIVPSLLSKWFNSRLEFKKLEKTAPTAEGRAYAEMQSYILKIKLNSFYGALLNQNFRFYDKRMGQSVTASGRQVLRHQLRKGCELIDGNYNIEPIVDDEDPRALRGEIASQCLTAGDTDSVVGDTEIYVNGNKTTIANFYDTQPNVFIKHDAPNQDYVKRVMDCNGLGFDGTQIVSKSIKYVMKHTVKKRMFEVKVNGKSVKITADHSIIVRRGTEMISTKPTEILKGDKLISINTPESVSP